ncbi:UNVERIFIED_ORG: pimeloyl-ACP methyl ester carboxylesterase [Methylobacterium sp. SuP10 SLI 274]|uniref:alpha/beta fold hydrolase n=1 Tax=Methylorubrum extorquens TaxID=408 RepID=UPI0020A04A66|nr:alpha/beta hydrolase [Methylorubrum extorquens]MCP1557896.1 pimeloyl-ACP methyl ester carboxylesterase [Methylorubrum extorquens]MDF9791500.1 pimeloyl-ACP methyl ester carboxylesterase [Methylorubrum extorquens]MDH6636805.1 pimeloyl-ACP methyl ester carboxylesterase [Methylobacterium sp. SuP10 SLI 274]MDH6665982.1 pimeloyl-ACP methyl ester carboxylesterase [Methylorubrum zatmanii]
MRENWGDTTIEWGSAEVEPGIRIHHGVAGRGERTVLLVHGYPETAYAWRRVVPLLVAAGLRVVVPDYRGAGGSSKSPAGYDKHTMAGDLHALLYDHLGLTGPVMVVGHDIGMMVAYAFARRFPDRTERLVVMEAPLPGTEAYRTALGDTDRLWHFQFHRAPDVPELLTAGREQLYLERFYQDLAFDTEAIGLDAVSRYVRAFSRPGAMRAGFELYRAFPLDAERNRADLKRDGKLTMPVLALAGSASAFAPFTEAMMREVAEDVTFATIERANHWVPEENAEAFAAAVLAFT